MQPQEQQPMTVVNAEPAPVVVMQQQVTRSGPIIYEKLASKQMLGLGIAQIVCGTISDNPIYHSFLCFCAILIQT